MIAVRRAQRHRLSCVGRAECYDGTEALAPSREKMASGIAEETVVDADRLGQSGFDPAEIGRERRDPDVVEDAHAFPTSCSLRSPVCETPTLPGDELPSHLGRNSRPYARSVSVR